ncbi:hypothetical protein [Methylomonas sp. 11b]|uniref:hypothetical protein n=1 Tax=Methylomonas sp. 11b TaxID=1168169 RepID=UPI0012DDC104|nr:hypothetical protein [Methylomonas sp. 11b]
MKKLHFCGKIVLFLAVILPFATNRSYAEEECAPDKAWLHPTSPPDLTLTPKSHPEGDDCPFYQAAWNTFLYATNPDGGLPAFVSKFDTIESALGTAAKGKFPSQKLGKLALLPRGDKQPGHAQINAGVAQAGDLAGILIDRDGYPVYYAIHMDPFVFTKFLRDNNLINSDPKVVKSAVQSFDKNKGFPAGAIELKSAWKVVPAGSKLDEKYFTVDAQVPRLKKASGADPDVVIDTGSPPLDVRVALVAIHVVFVLGNHSEFIWSTFEHTDEDGNPDSAPNGPIPNSNPPPLQTSEINADDHFLFFHQHTTVGGGNKASSPAERIASFDEATQRFIGKTDKIPSSIYRLYPFSKVNGKDDATKKVIPANKLDGQIVAVNKGMGDLFKTEVANGTADKRRYYRLVGAVWLDKPSETFKPSKPFKNGLTETSDDGIVAGEDALSSTAMESFTQKSDKNCFACHDTQDIPIDKDFTIGGKLINVSHIISKYLIDAPKP